MAKQLELTEEQKAFIDANADEISDLDKLTQAVFMDDSLDGRNREGRAVRAYCIERGIEFGTIKSQSAAKNIELDDDMRAKIEAYAAEDVNAFQIAKVLFPENKIYPLSKETLVVAEYIRENCPESLQDVDSAKGLIYTPPSNRAEVIKLVNTHMLTDYKLEKVTRAEEVCIDSMKKILNSPRFAYQMNSYTEQKERDLFEAEMIRACWEKDDLTADEVNLYINVCMDYINLKQIEKQKFKINEMFESAEGQGEMSIKLTEMIKTKNDEYDKCVGRIDKVITKLQGDRSKRMKDREGNTASVLAIVKLFQEEDSRLVMVRMAEHQNKLVKERADEIESMDSWMARVAGVSKQEAV